MKVALLVSEWCPTCPQAERVWRAMAAERDFEFAVLDLAQPEGRALAHHLGVKTIPAVVVDGTLAGVGVQTPEEARRMVAAAPARKRGSPLHAGMVFSDDNRLFVVSAMGYLMLAAAWLLVRGGWLSDDSLRPVGLHLFTVGFVLQLIYGVGAHMLPRFTGNPVLVGIWPWLQWVCVNFGIALYAAGFLSGSNLAVIMGGALVWLSLMVYALRMWLVLWRRDRSASRRTTPVAPIQ